MYFIATGIERIGLVGLSETRSLSEPRNVHVLELNSAFACLECCQ